MIKGKILPEKIFGIDSRLFVVWLKPFFLLLVIMVSFGLLILPKFNEARDNLGQTKKINSKIEEIKQKINYLTSIDQEELKNNSERLAMALLPEKNAYLLVKVLKNVAMDSGYTIDDFNISLGEIKAESTEKKKSTNYDRIVVETTMIGEANRYLDLVKSIEGSLPLMSIEKLKMNAVNESGTVDITVAAYYLKEITDLKIENLSLSDLTPSQKESELISTIMNFKVMGVDKTDEQGDFVKYERGNPFSTL